ncbi:MAG: G8 domain-containing protein, partial [Gemmataceae bacterium]
MPTLPTQPHFRSHVVLYRSLLCLGAMLLSRGLATAEKPSTVLRSARSGPWSVAATWEGGKVPAAGARVQIRTGHRVEYDVKSEQVIRSIHVAGILSFARDRDTRLDVGLIKIQSGEDASENGFDCDAHVADAAAKPALEVGTPDRPMPAGLTALIRLAYVEGLDRKSCPAIVCCGGRMDLHGAPMSRTWVKLSETAKVGDNAVTLAEKVSGWRVGDRILVTATQRSYREKGPFTEVHTLKALDGVRLTLDRPLQHEHLGGGDYRGEVANLSRNVVVESADPKGERGHTMYHRRSAGAISYAEFRHLGKPGVLGRYSLHYHLVGDT